MSEQTIWSTLKGINVEDKKMVEKKNNLSYISWAKAWSALCDEYPDAMMEKHCNEQGFPYFKDENGWCFTKVTVTVGSKSITEMLPVLNYANKPIQNPNSFEVNTSLQRCLAKAIALHGMGVQIYSGEDLQDSPTEAVEPKSTMVQNTPSPQPVNSQEEVKTVVKELSGMKNEVKKNEGETHEQAVFRILKHFMQDQGSINHLKEFISINQEAINKFKDDKDLMAKFKQETKNKLDKLQGAS